MAATATRSPGRSFENELWAKGAERVVGIDEVGRGSWAGPLTVAAAVIPRYKRMVGIRDSKQLSETRREALFARISQWCVDWAVGHASPAECDALGMSAAQRLAARRAIESLSVRPTHALVDGRWNFVDQHRDISTQMIVRGDRKSLSIAAVSVLAKVSRDRMMREAVGNFPYYEFDANKGYPCPRHIRGLQGYGPSSIHRKTWVFMDSLPWTSAHRPVEVREPDPRLF